MSFSEDVVALVERSKSDLVARAAHWPRAPMGELVDVLNGFPFKSGSFSDHAGIPIIRIRDVTAGATKTYYVGDVPEGYWVEDGDLVVGMDGDFNSRIWAGGRSLLNQRVCKLTPYQNALELGFLARLLPGYLKLINDATPSITVKHLSSKTLKETPIPVPPLAEQRRIVAKLDRLSAKRSAAEGHLARISKLAARAKQSILAAAFRGDLTADWRPTQQPHALRTSVRNAALRQFERDLERWQSTPTENRCSHKPRRPKPPAPISQDQRASMWALPKNWEWCQIGAFAFVTKLAGFEYTKFVKYTNHGDLPVLKAENAGPEGFRPTVYSLVDSSSVSHLLRSKLVGGEIMVVFVGAGVGNVAAVPLSAEFFLGPNVGMVRPHDLTVTPKYLEYFLRSRGGKELLLSENKAVAQPSISMGAIRDTPVPVCGHIEQAEIVRRIEAAFARIDRLTEEASRASHLLARLDERLLAKAFRGELVPQDPTDEPASTLLTRIRAQRAAAPKKRRRAMA